MNDLAKNLLLWVVILVVLMTVFQSFSGRRGAEQPLAYSDFLEQVKKGDVESVVIENQQIRGQLKRGQRFSAYSPETDNRSMIGTLLDNHGINIGVMIFLSRCLVTFYLPSSRFIKA